METNRINLFFKCKKVMYIYTIIKKVIRKVIIIISGLSKLKKETVSNNNTGINLVLNY